VREGIVYRAVQAEAPGVETPDDRSTRLLVAYDKSVLRREPLAVEFIARKFAIGYLEAMWETWDCTAQSARGLLTDIENMGFDFAEAQSFVGLELEKAGELKGALQRTPTPPGSIRTRPIPGLVSSESSWRPSVRRRRIAVDSSSGIFYFNNSLSILFR
jgi:hypothetical protein